MAATTYGCKSTICMPKHAPLSKVAATKGYGANVVLHGDFFDEAAAKASELAAEYGYTFVHPFNDPLVIAGQGTISLEILEDIEDIDAIIAPIGGGGLISGLAVAAEHQTEHQNHWRPGEQHAVYESLCRCRENHDGQRQSKFS